jgi:hypothetical protein
MVDGGTTPTLLNAAITGLKFSFDIRSGQLGTPLAPYGLSAPRHYRPA